MKKALKTIKRFGPLYFMMLPACIYIFINNYVPLPGVSLAFRQYNFQKGIYGSPFIGLSNFKFLFASKDAWIIIRNTIGYNLIFIILGTICAIAVAILLCEVKSKLTRKISQTCILIPYLVSVVIVSYLVFAFLSEGNGFINMSVLQKLGLDKISWYNEPKYWPFILVFVSIWKSSGYNCIIYLSAILGIDTSYNEAAMLDGASIWQRIRLITLPMIKPTILMLLILSVGRMFYSDFGLFYQVPQNSGALYPVTNVIDTYVYRALLQLGDIGMSSAAGIYQSIVGCILVIIANVVVRKYSEESALF